MPNEKAEIRARESRWAVPAGLASIAGVILLIVSRPLGVSGDGQAELLREANAHAGQVVLSDLMQALGFLLLAVPMVYLFRAVAARSDRVRSQLLGLVVAAPLFLALSSGLSIGVTGEGADTFVAGKAEASLTPAEARQECADERKDEGNGHLVDEYEPAKGETPLAACEKRKIEDDEASEAIAESSLAPVSTGLSLAGAFGFVIALLYTGLWSMRTGLLSRFWGSLGMVAGIAILLGPLVLVTLVFFVYFGMLCFGIVPGGKPPAWGAAEAIPWPTPGDRAAAELEPEGGWDEDDAPEPPAEEGSATPSDRR